MADERRRLFVIDTSSVIAIKQDVLAQAKRSEQEAVYDELVAMAERGDLLFPEQVIAELDRGEADLAARWGRRVEKKAIQISELASVVGLVLQEVPLLIDPSDSRTTDDADPWVVALALCRHREGQSVSVLTEEYKDRPFRITVSSACGMLEIPTMTVRAFLLRMRFWPKQGAT